MTAPWDLAPHQARALRVVARHGQIRPGQIAAHLRVAPRSVTDVIDALEERGLVERAPDPDDRRATVVTLTAPGRRLVDEIDEARRADAHSYFAQLSDRDQATLRRILSHPRRGRLMANAPAAGQALDVLALIARRGEPVPAAAIARDLGLPRSSVYHLLAVLVDRGYVRHLPEERRYGLGLAAYELGSAYQRQAPLERMARGSMDRLVDATGHNAHLAVLHGRDVLYVIEQRAPGRPLLVTDVGVRLPAVLTASGLAMLAALPAAQVRALFPDRAALVQRDGRGPTSTTQLRSQLQAVRQRGHAVEDGLVTPGLGSVAVAVLDHNDYPVAGVAVTYPQADVDAAETARHRRRREAGGPLAEHAARPARADPGRA